MIHNTNLRVYVSHSKGFDFVNDLYKPLKDAKLPVEFIFPHEERLDPYNSKELFEKNGCDCVLAEVSTFSTGQGIELGWANMLQIPILCVYKQNYKISGSLQILTKSFIEYSDSNDLINKLRDRLSITSKF